jgi:hypothetical protein
MEEYQNLDDTESEDSDDSPVLKELRNQLRAFQKENEKLKATQAEWEVAAQTQRATTAEEIMNTLSLPGLTEDILQWVGGDITQETVIEALEARSIPLPEGTEVQPKPSDDEPSASAVGQQVADAAAGKDGRDFDTRMAEAESQEEIVALMEEAGLSRSHS